MAKTREPRPRYRRITSASPTSRSKQHAPLRRPDTTSHGQGKQAANARRYDIAPFIDTRNGERGEERRYDTRDGAKSEAASRGTMTHDRRMTGRVSTMGQTEATPNTDDETTSPTRQASRNERDTRRTAEAPRQKERDNPGDGRAEPIELTQNLVRAVSSSSPQR